MAENDKTRSKRRTRRRTTPTADDILATALDLAEETGWSALQMTDVADRLNLSLADLLDHYRDKDALADAWFATAWHAMLAAQPDEITALPAKERLEVLLLRWFDSLAPHRQVTSEMLSEKGLSFPSAPLGPDDFQSLANHPVAARCGRIVRHGGS